MWCRRMLFTPSAFQSLDMWHLMFLYSCYMLVRCSLMLHQTLWTRAVARGFCRGSQPPLHLPGEAPKTSNIINISRFINIIDGVA